ncbi:short-subunit dehydrogenase [Streptomyces sp. 3211.6]|uniref:SDR family oxidoreductase n=1 Tax=Streptomyces TaxID=1883 RepID=UPI0009A4CD93|nr:MULTISPECIES: SDR family oxidoreductase [Streptomyces]RKT08475.1 short-subunit dehydrogenase [Streptomyces sp. 3211.6]RPF29874.1 short-subunit dehydrogenase [Streptomyces sp. Ag109_G2-6]
METTRSEHPRRPRQTVVVTGASAGVGRATAREFAARGARVALIARGRAGLEAAANEVAQAGGTPLVLPADVSDAAQVAAAADRVEAVFGPVDVWVNVAFTTVFAPFEEIRPEEFRRVTEVTYLGYVHGTRAALDRMLPRDSGTIVQVGSVLAERSIPLQSAYCGAKHAVQGFTSSVRTELMHRGSRVKVTVVQLPAVNTPQFSWGLSRLPHRPQPVPPIYQPEVAARAIVHAADHPGRRVYCVGGRALATVIANRLVPGLLDRYLARTGFASQQTAEPDPGPRPHNLWNPLDGDDGRDFGAHGTFDDRSHPHSPEAWAARRPRLLWTGAATAATLALAALRHHRTAHR